MNTAGKTLLLCLALIFAGPNVCGMPFGIGNLFKKDKIARHIAEITADSLILITGQTCLYTVDTPEDEGLVPTTLTVQELLKSLSPDDAFTCVVYDSQRKNKPEGTFQAGDYLEIRSPNGKVKERLSIGLKTAALRGRIFLHQNDLTIGTLRDITFDFFAGQRSPMTQVEIRIPAGINATLDNTTVNVIGRGEVTLRDLPRQSIGRTGTHYSYNRVGHASIKNEQDGRQLLTFSGLDFRPANGPDLRICFHGVTLSHAGDYPFEAVYTTSQPDTYRSPAAVAVLHAVSSVSDFSRNTLKAFTYNPNHDFTTTSFSWTPAKDASAVRLLFSLDEGRSWKASDVRLKNTDGHATLGNLIPDKLYAFKLQVKGGRHQGESNLAWYYSGRMDAKSKGVKGDGIADDTDAINALIAFVNRIGGGVVLFPSGSYQVRTLHMQSNVWLYVDKDAVIQALPGADAPEKTWFSDRAYRAGLSPTDPRPYSDPENYLTKQDVGHTFFRNAMFFGERIDNVKIIGTGRITGNGNLVTSDKVMNNAPEKRADKMFSFKLCTNLEIGGIDLNKDLWYDAEKDLPYYIDGGRRMYEDTNMLHIDRGGHFVLLATGTDGIHVHDSYFAKHHSGEARDIYDFMACNDVTVTNIYSRVSSDDIVKPGSDCSLGFTRPVRGYKVRNIIGDTNCNLFQIGSETADDIQDLCVDNIYVLGANKAGFSISTNDGGHIKNVHLNCGHTGPLHSRSVMHRTRAPFFISISNRGRVIGADVGAYTFMENGTERRELLVTNVNIGRVENIIINGVDINEVYAGSSFRGKRWTPYDGSQNKATPIIAGFKLPDPESVKGDLDFRLPNGLHTGYIENVRFTDVNLLVKGGHPETDALASPPEIGVGRYNVGDLKIQPSFGFWARHVKGFFLKDCTINAEKPDGRYAVVLDDVSGATVEGLKVADGISDKDPVEAIHSENIELK